MAKNFAADTRHEEAKSEEEVDDVGRDEQQVDDMVDVDKKLHA